MSSVKRQAQHRVFDLRSRSRSPVLYYYRGPSRGAKNRTGKQSINTQPAQPPVSRPVVRKDRALQKQKSSYLESTGIMSTVPTETEPKKTPEKGVARRPKKVRYQKGSASSIAPPLATTASVASLPSGTARLCLPYSTMRTLLFCFAEKAQKD